jgi:hypothetical protein
MLWFHPYISKKCVTNMMALPIDKMLYMCIYICIQIHILLCELFVCDCVYVHICVYTCIIMLRLLCFQCLFPTICKVNVITTLYDINLGIIYIYIGLWIFVNQKRIYNFLYIWLLTNFLYLLQIKKIFCDLEFFTHDSKYFLSW